jgi:isoleucyl-tRNA synthetase
VLVERVGRDGWALAESDGLTVALELALDEELEREGEVLDLIHRVNSMRKDAGLELTDRIRVTLPRSMAPLLEHADWIARETLAVGVEAGDVADPQIEKA